MKTLAFIFTIGLISCTSNNLQLSQDEVEYQKFVTEINRSPRPPKPISEWNEVYKSSGLQEYIFGVGDEKEQVKTLTDLDVFYEQVIMNKYLNHEYQESLKLKFISYAVSSFNLTQMTNEESIQHLIKYSRELNLNSHNFDFELSYRCISNIKGLIDKIEYNEMVKKSLFALRYGSAKIENSLKEAKTQNSKEDQTKIVMFEALIENHRALQSAFEALIIK